MRAFLAFSLIAIGLVIPVHGRKSFSFPGQPKSGGHTLNLWSKAEGSPEENPEEDPEAPSFVDNEQRQELRGRRNLVLGFQGFSQRHERPKHLKNVNEANAPVQKENVSSSSEENGSSSEESGEASKVEGVSSSVGENGTNSVAPNEGPVVDDKVPSNVENEVQKADSSAEEKESPLSAIIEEYTNLLPKSKPVVLQVGQQSRRLRQRFSRRRSVDEAPSVSNENERKQFAFPDLGFKGGQSENKEEQVPKQRRRYRKRNVN
ncbi:uncharacterized protein O3C94_017394 [Discoglossus pictus]